MALMKIERKNIYRHLLEKVNSRKNKAGLQQSNHQEQTATPLRFDKGQHRMCCKIIIESKL